MRPGFELVPKWPFLQQKATSWNGASKKVRISLRFAIFKAQLVIEFEQIFRFRRFELQLLRHGKSKLVSRRKYPFPLLVFLAFISIHSALEQSIARWNEAFGLAFAFAKVQQLTANRDCSAKTQSESEKNMHRQFKYKLQMQMCFILQ